MRRLARLDAVEGIGLMKTWLVTGGAGFLGGVNIHDPATSTHSGHDAWRDQHVRIEGEPVRKLQRLFLENWTYSGGSFRLTTSHLVATCEQVVTRPAPAWGALNVPRTT